MKNIIKFKDVITTDEKKEIADKLEEEYRKTKDMPPEDDAADNDVELTPIEELAELVINQVVCTAIRGFADMVNGMDIELTREIIRRMGYSNAETATRVLQAMFLITERTDEADMMDLIGICAEFYSDAYDFFVDELFDTEMFDWFFLERMLEETNAEPVLSICLS